MIEDEIKVIKNYKNPFSQFVKKQTKPFRAVIEDEVNFICTHPCVGELKIGDLSGIRIHKFKFNRQQHLIAYSFVESEVTEQNELEQCLEFLIIDFYKIGSHENFYEDLKTYLKSVR